MKRFISRILKANHAGGPSSRYWIRHVLGGIVVGLAAACTVCGPAYAQPAATGAQSAQPPAAQADSSALALPNKGLSVSTETGFGIFQNTCLSCHGRPEYKNAPSPATLRSYSPERIYDALTSGPMKAIGDTFTDNQKKVVAQAIAGRLFGATAAGDADRMPNKCTVNAPMSDPSAGPSWNGWGNSIANTRFQPAARAQLTAANVSRLKLKWAFGLPGSTSAYSQPAIVSGRVFVGSDTGYIYSLDAKSGCVYWSFRADAGVRNAMTIEPVQGHGAVRYGLFFGDLKANVYGLDAETGKLLWKSHIDKNYTTRVTAPPAYYNGTLFVPISSWEEFSAKSLDYPCCTSVGAVVALDANTGRRLWKTYVVAERPHPTRKNAKGVQQYAPAGGSVWNTPAVDAKRNAIYFGTGDATTYPAAKTSDAVMALDIATGRVLWSHQVTSGDSFLVGCRGDGVTDNCPSVEGPDWDIPASAALATLKDGRQLVIVATKPGDVLALDPANGNQVWRMNVNGKLAGNTAAPGPRGPGLIWGGAVHDGTIYYGLTGGAKMVAIDLSNGKLLWTASLKGPHTDKAHSAFSAPATAIPGVVFLAGSDGSVIAASSANGRIMWRYNTNRAFDAVNKVSAHGGSIGSGGVAVAGGMIFVGSGYSILGPTYAGNVLLAFSTH